MSRVLVVLDEAIASADQIPEEVEAELQAAEAVHVVAPALNGRLAALCSDDDRARHEADERLAASLAFLHAEHIEADGEIGDENPLQAIEDALADFDADEIVLAVHDRKHENWREHHLVDRLRTRVDLPTRVVTVPPAA